MTENFGIKALGIACKERTYMGNTLCTHCLLSQNTEKLTLKILKYSPLDSKIEGNGGTSYKHPASLGTGRGREGVYPFMLVNH